MGDTPARLILPRAGIWGAEAPPTLAGQNNTGGFRVPLATNPNEKYRAFLIKLSLQDSYAGPPFRCILCLLYLCGEIQEYQKGKRRLP